MSRKAIRRDTLAEVVADMDRVFATKDVSEDARMLAAHRDLTSHSHYHAFVGGALSDHSVFLGIVEVRKGTSRGSRWEKQGTSTVTRRDAPQGTVDSVAPSAAKADSLGPQDSGDNSFTARMRLHQSWYRVHVLNADIGTGPTWQSKSPLGNMLTREDGAVGANFLTPEIAALARERVARGGGAVEPYRLFHNMLSSQPMCFNLFGPLAQDAELARQLVAELVPDEVDSVSKVALEYAPEPSSEYLGDRTAFDAFIEYVTPDGSRSALGIETKLTEPFSQKEYDGEHYRRWMRMQGAPWRENVDNVVQRKVHNQLWRGHLLAVAMQNHPRSIYAKVRFMVIYHPADHRCTSVIAEYRALLREGDDSFLALPLDRLHKAWVEAVGDTAHGAWLRDFGLRYLQLDQSNA